MQTTLLTTAQVADRVRRSVATVNRAAAADELRAAVTLPGETGARLYDPAEVDRWASTFRRPRPVEPTEAVG